MYLFQTPKVRATASHHVHVHVCVCDLCFSLIFHPPTHTPPSPPSTHPPTTTTSHRVMGSLLSAYLLIQSPENPFGPLLSPDDPSSQRLLELAHDLAIRLLPSFEGTTTGIPHPRVSVLTYSCTYIYMYIYGGSDFVL